MDYFGGGLVGLEFGPGFNGWIAGCAVCGLIGGMRFLKLVGGDDGFRGMLLIRGDIIALSMGTYGICLIFNS